MWVARDLRDCHKAARSSNRPTGGGWSTVAAVAQGSATYCPRNARAEGVSMR